MTFNDMPINGKIKENLQKAGFTKPTPIQEQAVPPLMDGKDVMACAQTGTGKTAAFVLPLLNRLCSDSEIKGHGPRVLILTPTRELGMQVLENIRTLSKGMHFKTGLIIGGTGYGPQYKMLRENLDIMVATPGRLIDHMQENRVDFSRIEAVVLDEADRMLDMGFLKPVESILAKAPQNRQTMLFSATFSKAIEGVAKKMLNNPVRIELAPATTRNENITQYALNAKDRNHKHTLLEHVLANGKVWQAIVFIKTKHGADRLAKKLEKDGHRAAALHGDMRQGARKRVMSRMHDGHIKVLIATDVAARGLDVKSLSHVINYDMPQVAEDYVHRIGRTGRAGETGIAISLIGGEDRKLLRDVEKYTGQKITFEQLQEGNVKTAPSKPAAAPTTTNGPKRVNRDQPFQNQERKPKFAANSAKPGKKKLNKKAKARLAEEQRRPAHKGSKPKTGGGNPRAAGSKPTGGGNMPPKRNRAPQRAERRA